MLYLVMAFDRVTKEPVPLGIFDNKDKIKRIFDGLEITIMEYTVNKPDYEAIDGLA